MQGLARHEAEANMTAMMRASFADINLSGATSSVTMATVRRLNARARPRLEARPNGRSRDRVRPPRVRTAPIPWRFRRGMRYRFGDRGRRFIRATSARPV